MATAALYGGFILSLLNKEIDLDTDPIRVRLHSSAYTPNQDTHRYVSDLTNELATAGGYTAGGATLSGVTVTYNASTNVVTFDANDVSWSSATFTARYATLAGHAQATDATRPLIGYQNFTTDQSVSNGTFTIQWNAGGIFTITVGAEA